MPTAPTPMAPARASVQRAIRLLAIHCLDVPNGRATTVADVDRWHRERGFQMIGYHHVIYLDGSIHAGRPHSMVGAHVKGWNADSLGIALVGRDRYTAPQWEGLARLVLRLGRQYQIPLQTPDFHAGQVSGVVGHCEFPNVGKTCPGFSVSAWLRNGMHPPPETIFPWGGADHAGEMVDGDLAQGGI